MGLFSKGASSATTPSARRIPTLESSYYVEIHESLRAAGSDETLSNVAYAVANAIENVAHRIFDAYGDPRAAKRFDAAFGRHAPDDLSAADRMIDWLVDWDSNTQEVLETTLRRLGEVLSKPAPA